MFELTDLDGKEVATETDTQDWILTKLVIKFSDDKVFLEKVNKITFGLISGK
jgi:hypothetical protein